MQLHMRSLITYTSLFNQASFHFLSVIVLRAGEMATAKVKRKRVALTIESKVKKVEMLDKSVSYFVFAS